MVYKLLCMMFSALNKMIATTVEMTVCQIKEIFFKYLYKLLPDTYPSDDKKKCDWCFLCHECFRKVMTINSPSVCT